MKKGLKHIFLCRTGIVAAVISACLLVACGGGRRADDARPAALAAQLKTVEDSVMSGSPRALGMIKSHLGTAKDSLEYYDYYLLMLRYNTVNDVQDTTGATWRRAYSFLNRLQKTPRVNGMLAYLHNINALYDMRYQHSNDSVTAHFAEAYRFCAESDVKEKLPDACANLADAYMNDNNLPRAAMLYRRALLLVDSLRLPESNTVSLYLGLGRIYLKLKDYDSALECFAKTDARMKLLPLNMQIYFLNSYGNYFYYKEDYAKALHQFLRLERLLLKHNMTESFDMYICRLNLADVYLNLGRSADATRMLDIVEPFFRRVGFNPAIYYCNTIRIGLAMRRNDTRTVRSILDNEHIHETMEFNLIDIRHRYLNDYYVRTGDYRKAYQTLKSNILHNDSMLHNITYMRTSEIMMRYTQDTLQLHHHIAIQEKDANIQHTRTALYGVASLVLILALLLLWLFTYNRKRAMQAHIQLMRMKLTSARNRISPHFIFNVLNNRISSTTAEDADELMALAKLIRANLNMSGKFYVTLKEELDFVRYYISVERENIGPDFTFTVSAPADDVLEGIICPSMFVQILVENSIKHALKGHPGEKKLHIGVARENHSWIVTVTDNGPGFDIRRSSPTSTGTGLKVIRNSISLINSLGKRKVTLSINNLKDAEGRITGCRVSLTLSDGLKSGIDKQ